MLRSRDQAIVLVEFTTSASAVSAEGTWGRNAAGVGTGRRPPEAARRRLPPGPSTARGVRNPPPRARWETGAAVPGFAERTLCPGGCPVLSS
jgi:hypothetical protein